MKILFIASEAAPMAKVGGLADVVGSLPKALRTLGHDVRILIPQYASFDTQRFPLAPVIRDFKFSMQGKPHSIGINQTVCDEVPVYTLENEAYFGNGEIYGRFDLDRFFFFSRAVFEILPELYWQPEILHCHDWLTSLVILYQKKANYPYSTVFTIHNLAYQGFFDENYMNSHDLRKYWDSFPQDVPRPHYSFMSQAILWADVVTTVSETYAREITTPEFGVGQEALLKYRSASGKLTGIVNGIDYEYWNPQIDPYLPVNFNSTGIKKRALNKIALQKVAGLPVNSEIPLIGMVQRMDEQKGIDIVGRAIETLLKETGAQLVILGRGQEYYENLLRRIGMLFPQQVSVFVAFEEALAHLIYAGCDMFLMPSHFEPCGLGQMIAMRYGALPIVRHTGGLVDTVPKLSSDLRDGNGFVFHEYSPAALITAVKEAVEAFKNHKAWLQAAQRVSRLDFSWQSSARKYESAYHQVLKK
jgi:starch synthase